MKHFFLLVIVTVQALLGQTLQGGGEANPELSTNEKSLQQWRALRFGLFIHWGPVAQRGTEIGWSRDREIPIQEYDQLYRTFNPIRFNADQWVQLAKKAGMKYLVLVTKHHDGFSLWDTQASDYDIMASPFQRDIVAEMARACRKQGILFGTYYSILDWHHPDYPMQNSKKVWKENHDMPRYVQFCRLQLQELVSRYHTKIAWFDGQWEEPWTHDMGMELYRYVRGLDRTILINNRVDKNAGSEEGSDRPGQYAGDFATPEQRIGQYDVVTPWESCITLCTQWAYKPDDELKSLQECIHTLVQTAGGDGNLLLNVGPMPDGRIEERQAQRLLEVGAWLKQYGKTIYQTRGGPVPPQPWGVTTHRGNTIFVHVLQPGCASIVLPELPGKIKSAKMFADKKAVSFQQKDKEAVLNIPPAQQEEMDLVIEVKMQRR